MFTFDKFPSRRYFTERIIVYGMKATISITVGLDIPRISKDFCEPETKSNNKS